MERIFKAAKAQGFEVFISPHYFYPIDRGWKFNGPLEADEVASGMFARTGVLNLDGFKGSGADWLERFKPYIEDGKTIVIKPGPKLDIVAENDLPTRSKEKTAGTSAPAKAAAKNPKTAPTDQDEIFRASPTPSDGQLFIRSTTVLYCVGKK